MVKRGSKWTDNGNKVFHVIDIVTLEGNTWVHYILEDKNDPKEFSCYVESFVTRFRQMPE
jgi:hypothetical protein